MVRACDPNELMVEGFPRSGSAAVLAAAPGSAKRAVSVGGVPTGGVWAESGANHTDNSSITPVVAHVRRAADKT